MKAVVFHEYGAPNVLRLEEVEKPVPGDDELLIRVHAASVNSWDRDLLRGMPFANRLMFGVLKPKTGTLGCDIAGRVEAVGGNAKQFQPGNEVFGDISVCGFGGFAQYVCARENVLAQHGET
jgi:NADPH:quinone reductase-like Zn-dependent oxidoreductase